jgi:CRISPR-associated endonuclease/helicase Cas3
MLREDAQQEVKTMSLERATKKSERLLQIEALLLAHPEGLSQAELARRIGVNRSTINRALPELTTRFSIYETDDGRLCIDRDHYLADVRFTLHEALSLHLAARLMATSTDKQNPHAAASLRKLGIALEKLAPFIAEHLKDSADVMDDAARYHDPVYLDALEALTRAWSLGRKVSLKHQLPDLSITEYTFAPYFVEPYAVGQSTHTIGWREPPGALRTFKVERIRAVKLLDTPYTIPPDFDARALLADAWGIWYTEQTPVTVRLRFHPRVAARVQETHWHRNAVTTLQPDGYLLWEAQIAEPREMLPWVRGWGGDVEVLAPEETREAVAKEVRRMGRVYGMANANLLPAYQQLWGKIDRNTKYVHRLTYHMIDVGQVASVLWQVGLHQNIRQALADWLQLGINETGKFVAFLAALHDLGKASPAFQDHHSLREPLKSQIKEELQATGFQFADRAPSEKHTRHEILTTWALRSSLGEGLLHQVCGLGDEMTTWLAQVLGGHHGTWPQSERFGAAITPADKGKDEWTKTRTELVGVMKRLFDPPGVSLNFDGNCAYNNIMLTYLSAIISIADWIGSDDDYFPLEENTIPIASYARHSRQHAQCALKSVNLKPPMEMLDLTFEKVFPFHPTEAQTQGIAALADLSVPALAIIEAPMGTGKTELAFAVYAHWAKQNRSSGLYVAMPTTATSNQMHDRTAQFLTKQLDKPIEPLLVHSQALLRKIPEQKASLEEQEGDVAAAQSWFLPRKQSLLAPYGVGTVDQALMSILQTKHFFVRLLGLSHKVVIFDEVHAYDAYMSELFERLLQWLRAINTSVIILSATLPDKTRQKLIRAYTGTTTALPAKEYPQITFAPSNGPTEAIKLTPPPTKELSFGWLSRDVNVIIKTLDEALHNGGCAAVICNTISYAQEIFEAIQDLPDEHKLCDTDNLILFHARFPLAWREGIEEKVLRKLGPGPEKKKPNPDRPNKVIVVATQVIEQSLDLDFDVMISDHAPVDLLLQRAGRLHRHAVNDPRSHPYRLWVTVPAIGDEVPHFERRKYVYDEYVLLRSWLALQEQSPNIIHMPDDMPDLIEYVYSDRPLSVSAEMTTALEKTKQAMDKEDFDERAEACKRRVREPQDERLLWRDNLELEEDDPRVRKTFRALTRSGDPGLSVICLHRIAGQLHLEPEAGSLIYDPNEKPDSDLVRELARRSVNIRRRETEDYLLEKPSDDETKTILRQWKYIAVLRYHRVVIFENGLCPLEGTGLILKLDKKSQLGLQIIQEAR